jgi:hypothetical protein
MCRLGELSSSTLLFPVSNCVLVFEEASQCMEVEPLRLLGCAATTAIFGAGASMNDDREEQMYLYLSYIRRIARAARNASSSKFFEWG